MIMVRGIERRRLGRIKVKSGREGNVSEAMNGSWARVIL